MLTLVTITVVVAGRMFYKCKYVKICMLGAENTTNYPLLLINNQSIKIGKHVWIFIQYSNITQAVFTDS